MYGSETFTIQGQRQYFSLWFQNFTEDEGNFDKNSIQWDLIISSYSRALFWDTGKQAQNLKISQK